MHIQVPGPGWLDAAMLLPDDSLLKSVHDASPLREAKQKWQSLSRDPKRLVTMYRHFGLEPAPPGSTWAQAVAHWRVNFAKFIDGTWRSKFAGFVDLVEDCNEYTAVSTWVDDPDQGESKILSMEAAAWVWNNDYRGQGTIPATCRFTLMCGPVANWWPVEIYDLSLKYDAPINYHAYFQCLNGERVAGDFRDASGLAANLESHYGKYPEYVYGEVMPYKSSAEGWKAAGCLAGDAVKLVDIARTVQRDTQATRLFREGRLLGRNSYGAWFTVGGGTQWALYELEAPQLNALAKMYAEEALTAPPQEEPMDAITKAKIKEHAQAILDLVDPHVWKVGDVALANTNPLVTYTAPNGPVKDKRPPTPPGGPMVTYDLNVLEVSADGLWLRVAPALWVKVADVKLKGT